MPAVLTRASELAWDLVRRTPPVATRCSRSHIPGSPMHPGGNHLTRSGDGFSVIRPCGVVAGSQHPPGLKRLTVAGHRHGGRYAHAAQREDSACSEEQGSSQHSRPWRSGPGRLTGPSCGWLPSPGLRCGHGRRPSPHRVGIRAAEGSLGGNGGLGGARCQLRPGRTPPPGEAVRGSVLDGGVWRRMRLRRLPGARRRGPG